MSLVGLAGLDGVALDGGAVVGDAVVGELLGAVAVADGAGEVNGTEADPAGAGDDTSADEDLQAVRPIIAATVTKANAVNAVGR